MTQPTYDFIGQVTLMTGAGSDMGLATAEAFAHAGAAVVLAGGHAQDVKEAAERLASQGRRAPCSDASSVVLGVALPVDGGYTAH